jgi:hypothetical protein
VAEARRVADVPGLTARLASKEADAAASDLWDNAAAGQALMAEIAELRFELQDIKGCAVLNQYKKRSRQAMQVCSAVRALFGTVAAAGAWQRLC